MAKYRTLTLVQHPSGTTHEYHLHEDDQLERVEGGIQLRWHSSPKTTTFYPYHRVWDYTEIDTE